jgi:hypothetical protein
MTRKIEIIQAEQQLTGFAHAYQGYDITSLIEAMNLTVEEWEELKEDGLYLPERLQREIDNYFDRKK